MNKLKILFKKDLINDYSFFINYKAHQKKEKSKKIIGYIILAIYLVALAAFFVYQFLNTYDIFKAVNLQNYFLFTGYAIHLGMVLIFGVSEIFSKLYFSNDGDILLPLPLSKTEIFRSKVLNFSFYNMLFSLICIFPIVIKYGTNEGMGTLFYIESVLSAPLITLLYMSILSFIIVLLMSFFSGFGRIKNFLQIIGMLLVLFISVKFSSSSGKIFTNPQQLVSGSEVIKNKFAFLFLPLNLLLRGMIEGEILSFIIFAIISIAVFYLVTEFMAGVLFFGLQRMGNVKTKKKTGAVKKIQKSSKVRAIAMKELREIFKTPIYFYNILAGGIIMPVIFYLSIRNAGDQEMEVIVNALGDVPGDKFIGALILFSVLYMIFIGGIGQSAMSAFSREGKNIWQLKNFPLTGRDIVLGKVLPSLLFQFISLAVVTILSAIILKLNFIEIIVIIMSGTVGAFFTSNLGFFLDIRYPKLDWDNPQKAVKDTRSAMIMFFVTFPVMMAFILFITFKAQNKSFNLDFGFAPAFVLAFILILGIVFYKINLNTAENKLRKIQ